MRCCLRLSLLGLFCLPLPVQAADFPRFLQEIREEARAAHIPSAAIEATLAVARFEPRVISLDQRQPEKKLSFVEYRNRTLTTARIRRGQMLLAEHHALLEKISRQYGVQPRFIVALWGKETDYGAYTGSFSTISALATLAFEGRRAAFFRAELLAAIRMVAAGAVRPEQMIGSWAGAMGQSQFMPSSYLRYAADGDGDGDRDIWGSLPDIFASMANYLRAEGWNGRYSWGREVQAPASLVRLAGLDFSQPLDAWQAAGVRRLGGGDLPALYIAASLLFPDGPGGPAILAYGNYRVLMHWNRSIYFATVVGLLADRLNLTG